MLLEDIRSWAHSWLMTILLVMIIVPFAFWGINQYFHGGGSMVVAEVDDTPIGVREFQQALQQQRYRLQAVMGSGLELDEAAEDRLKRETLNRMIEESVLVDRATDKGMTVGDEQLATLIHAQQAFQSNGQFSRDRYEAWLHRQGYAPGGFEQSFRRSLVIRQLQLGVVESAFLTGAERERLERLQGQRRTFAYLTIPAARYRAQVQVSDEQVQSFFREHQADFLSPEQVDAEYVEVSREALAASVEVSEEELRQRYDSQRATFGERSFEDVRATLLREVQLERSEAPYFEQGERLANLAFEHPDSLEPAAKALGLEVRSTGFFPRKGGEGIAAEPRFVSAAFGEEVFQQGHNSEPVELSGGRVVVLRARDVRPAVQRSLDEVRAEVVERLSSRAATEQAEAAARAVVQELQGGLDRAELARREGLEWVEVVEGKRRASGIDPAISARVFQLPKPVAEQRVFGTAPVANGDAAVIALQSVLDGEPAAKTAGAPADRILDQAYGQATYDSLVETLRTGASVEVYNDRL